MDKAFWRAIKQAGYLVPPDHDLGELMGALLGAIGSTDVELRAALAGDILGTWIRQGAFHPDALRGLTVQLAGNLTVGLGGDQDTSVLLRSSSVRLLAEVLAYDVAEPFLEGGEVEQFLKLAIAYLVAERDTRGFVPGCGPARALCHAGELLASLAANRHVGREDLERLLSAIADRVMAAHGTLFLEFEDERLAAAVMGALRRDLLGERFLAAWVRRLGNPPGRSPWAEASASLPEAFARSNTVGFLRSLALQLHEDPDPPPAAPLLTPMLGGALRSIEHGAW